jgi:PAS domain S-box-containing protein
MARFPAQAESMTDLLEAKLRAGASEGQANLRAGLEEVNTLWKALLAQADHLALERQRYAEFFEYAPDAYVVTDPAGMIREANQLAAEFLGASRDLLCGRALSSFISYDDRPAFRARLALLSMEEAGSPRNWRTTVRTHDRKARPVRLSVRSIRAPGQPPTAFCWLLQSPR